MRKMITSSESNHQFTKIPADRQQILNSKIRADRHQFLHLGLIKAAS